MQRIGQRRAPQVRIGHFRQHAQHETEVRLRWVLRGPQSLERPHRIARPQLQTRELLCLVRIELGTVLLRRAVELRRAIKTPFTLEEARRAVEQTRVVGLQSMRGEHRIPRGNLVASPLQCHQHVLATGLGGERRWPFGLLGVSETEDDLVAIESVDTPGLAFFITSLEVDALR